MRERAREEALAVVAPRELDRGAGELGLGRDQEEVRERGRLRELADGDAVEQVVAGGAVRPHPEPRGRVRLRVEVDDERALTGLGEARGEVDGGRRLADAALLVRERIDLPAIVARRRGAADGLGQRPLAGDSGAARETGGRRARLAEHARGPAASRPSSAASRAATRASSVEVGALADPEHRGAARADERQAPLGRDRRRRQRLRERDAGPVESPAPRRGPGRTRAFGGAHCSRNVALPAARPRAARTRGRGARARAGSPASRSPSRRRRSDPSKLLDEPAAAPSASVEQSTRGRPRGRAPSGPGVSTTARSQASSRLHGAKRRLDDDVAVRLVALARRRHAVVRPRARCGRSSARPRSSARARPASRCARASSALRSASASSVRRRRSR